MDSNLTMVGNVGTAVNFKAGESGTSKWSRAEFRLGSTRRVRRPDGTWIDAGTTWVSVLCWGRLADGVKDSISKGDPVVVTGRLVTDDWTDANGEVHTRNVLAADAVGHDLSRGRGRFARTFAVPDPMVAGVPDPAFDDGEDAAIEASDDDVDAALAELTREGAVG